MPRGQPGPTRGVSIRALREARDGAVLGLLAPDLDAALLKPKLLGPICRASWTSSGATVETPGYEAPLTLDAHAVTEGSTRSC